MKKTLLLALAAVAIAFSSCKKDKCKDVNCYNDGICEDGNCQCPTKWTGNDCSEKRTPNSMRMNKIILKQFPTTDNGTPWDAGSSYPDVYVVLYDNQSQSIVWSSDVYYEEATSPGNYGFPIDGGHTINRVKDRWSIYVIDYDSADEDDVMGGIEFAPYSDPNDPATVSMEAGDYKMDVEYTYNY